MPVCLCGCGRETKLPTSKYCPGHNRHTEATKELLRTKAKQRWANPLFRLTVVGTGKLGVKKGYKRSPENCRAISDGRKVRMMQDLEFRQREIDKLLVGGKPWNTGKPASEALLRGLKTGWGWNKGLTKETDLRVAKYAETLKVATSARCPKQRKQLSQRMLAGQAILMRNKSSQCKPTSIESKLDEILQRNFPNQWRYVGDGKVIIEGRCPDFININGRKQVIELFGDYWHSFDLFNEPRKLNQYARYGYSCLVIWEHELKNGRKLILKLRKFIGRKG